MPTKGVLRRVLVTGIFVLESRALKTTTLRNVPLLLFNVVTEAAIGIVIGPFHTVGNIMNSFQTTFAITKQEPSLGLIEQTQTQAPSHLAYI